MVTSPEPPMPDAPRARLFHGKPILITLVCGVLLGFGSCFGFLNTFNINGPAKPGNVLFAIGFVVGVALVVYAGIWALVSLIKYVVHAARDER